MIARGIPPVAFGLLVLSSCVGARVAQAPTVVRYSRPPAPRERGLFEPFLDVVCRVEAERARIADPRFVTVRGAEALAPYSCGSTTWPEAVFEYQQQASGRAVLRLLVQGHRRRPEGSPTLASLAFRVPEAGRYYLFLKGDSCCCGCSSLEFRLDGGPAQVSDAFWGIGEWGWQSLKARAVKLPRGRDVRIPEAVQFGAGRHSLDLVWAAAPCDGLVLDELVVARDMRLENQDRWEPSSTLLHRAAEAGHKPLVELLLARGAPVNIGRQTPLMLAESGRHTEVADLLRRHGTIPSSEVKSFFDAVEDGAVQAVEALLEQAPALLSIPMEYRRTALHLAATHGSFILWPSQPDHPAVQARARGRTQVAALLIARGADVDRREVLEGWTPLHWAAYHGSLETARVLLAHGADAGARDYQGRTPVHVAAEAGEGALIGLLLDAGVDVSARADGAWSPLHTAANYDQKETATLLLDRGADLDAIAHDGRTPLWQAALSGYTEMVELLVRRGAAVDRADDRNWTPLHSAVDGGRPELVKLLVRHGARVNAADRDGRTPLHVAAQRFHIPWERDRDYAEVIRTLLATGADAAAKDTNGRTPLDCACPERRDKVAKLLGAAARPPEPE